MLGFSLYLNQNKEEIIKKLEEFKNYDFLFTSMHYPLEDENMDKLLWLLDMLKNSKTKVCVDLNGEVLEKFPKLLDLNIIIRLDFGFNNELIAKLSKKNKLAINASTIDYNNLMDLKEKNSNFSNISAWHNYYPLSYSGLGSDEFIKKNKMLKAFGIDIFAFFQGDNNFRGPMFESLPTLEEDRWENPYYSYLKLKRKYRKIKKGDLVILNKNAKRYSGELEIIRKDIGEDKMRNIIGHVDKSHLGVLDLIGGSDRLVINRIKK